MSCLENIALIALSVIGLRILIRLANVAWKRILAPNFGFGIDVTTQGKWAVITGATSGIGKAYAVQLAEKGLDIVLISRSQSKLDEVATEIKQLHGVEVRTIEADLTEGQAVFAKIAKATEELEIAVLVNNAGASYDHPDLFIEVSEETLARILQLNVAGITGVARAVLPRMFERKKGVLINISSAAAIIPGPYLSVYSATKAYVTKFSEDLAAEAERYGVTVQCVMPGLVATKMSKIKKPTWMAPSAEKYVECSLKTVGIESSTIGYTPHYIMVIFVHTVACVCDKAAVWLLSKVALNLRSRALKRKAKLGKNDVGDRARTEILGADH